MKTKLYKIALLTGMLVTLAGCTTVFNSDPIAHSTKPIYYTDHGETNLWTLLGKDLKMEHHPDNPDVKSRIVFYLQKREFLEKMSRRATPYVYYVLQQIKQRKMPTEIALLPMVESSYDPFAYSGSGAAGLWQMMPGTASGFSIRQNWWYDGRRDIYASTQAALDYLQYLYVYFHNDWLLALAAYNSGEGTVGNAVKLNETLGQPTDFWHLHLPEQTRQYVPKLMALAIIIADPQHYRIDWPTSDLAPNFTQVAVDGQIDLELAAKLANISDEQLRMLNPGFNQWATDPNGSHVLILPVTKVNEFEANLTKLPMSERVTWNRYTVQQGDTVAKVARRFKTTPDLIQQINDLKNPALHHGQVLLVPKERQSFTKAILASIKHYLKSVTNLPGPNRLNYTTKKGDTIERLARLYKLPAQNIRYWNQLKKDEELTEGKELIIWLPKRQQHYNPIHLRKFGAQHVVAEGDTLQSLARQYHTTPEAIQKANRLTLTTLQSGSTVSISHPAQNVSHEKSRPTHYTVQAGDTLTAIAQKFHVSPHSLKQANHLKSDKLKLRQSLKIPPQK